jgi:carboxylesterase
MRQLVRAGPGDKSPVVIGGDRRAVLVLHGFSGTPWEVRPIAEAFGRLGCSVEAPTLAGHGAALADLARSTWRDWLSTAEAAVGRLEAAAARDGAGPAPPVAVVGFSMGGLLALRLARLYPQRISALAVISAPLRLRRLQVLGIRALARLPIDYPRHPRLAVPKLFGSDLSDPAMRAENPALNAFPLAALENLIDVMDTVRADLPSVRQPALVVHGRHDHTVPMDDSLELTGSLGSDVIERLWLERSFHVVARDVERAAVLEAVTRFIGKHAGWSVVA